MKENINKRMYNKVTKIICTARAMLNVGHACRYADGGNGYMIICRDAQHQNVLRKHETHAPLLYNLNKRSW
jgi:tartrate dehydratase beta subunit/fumarate hydratase class I family protein